jgi:hypothetical protein
LVSCGGTARYAVERVDHCQLELAIGAVMSDGDISRTNVDVSEKDDVAKE